MAIDIDNLIPQQQLAEKLNVTEKTLIDWAKRGVKGQKLARLRVGRKVYYERWAVEIFIRATGGLIEAA